MPQQVWPSGNSTSTPRPRSSRTIATPTSGKNMSPRQVIIRAARTGAPTMLARGSALDVGRRRRHEHQHEQERGAVVDEAVAHPRGSHHRVARLEPLLGVAHREAPAALDHVVDLVLALVAVGGLRLAGRHAVEIELGARGAGQADLGHPVGRNLHVIPYPDLHRAISVSPRAPPRTAPGATTSLPSPRPRSRSRARRRAGPPA